MRAVIQRVKEASVTINNNVKSSINQGFMILLGIEYADNTADIEWLSSKISQLRIFNDQEGVMNKSILDVDGEIIVVSQFTLHARTKKGNRPSYINAAKTDIAVPLYEEFVSVLSSKINKEVQTGEFGAMMDVALVNDGPVTILMDTKNRE